MTSKRHWIGVTMAVLAFSTLTASAADWDVDLRAGWYAAEAEGPFIGGGALGPLGHYKNWFLNPNLEVAFGDEVDYLTINGDVHYDFAKSGDVSFWVGGGLAIVQTNPDGPADDETDLGLNAIFGLAKRSGGVRPFGQAKIILSDETEFVLMGGIRF